MRRSLSLVLLFVVVVLGGLVPSSVDAHSGKQSYLYLSIYDDGVEGRVEIPAVDLGRVLGTEIPQDPDAALEILDGLTEPVIAYVEANTALSDDSGPWRIEFEDTLSVLPTENGLYVLAPFVVDEEFSDAPPSLIAEFSVIIESDPEKDALLIIEDDWGNATFDNEADALLGFSIGLTEQRAELGGASTFDSIVAIRGIGTDGVRTGIDVMLIVVAVALPAVMVPATRRTHVVTASTVARRGAAALAALVVGHSITLWLAAFGVLTPSARVSGVLVAAGLCAMAIYGLASWWRPRLWSFAVPVVGVVGLLQGIGLGEYFVSVGLDRRRTFTSLLAFHVGVEVAVVILVVLVAVPLWILRRTRVATLVELGLGVVLAGYGFAWLFERIADSDWPIEEIANPLRVWPRNLVFVAIAVAAAVAIRRLDERGGHLRPIDADPHDAPNAPRADQEAALP